MKLPIIEYAVTLGGFPIATAVDEDQAVRFMRLIEAAVTPGIVLAGPLGVETVKREVEAATVADVDVRSLDTAAMATAYDAVQVAKAAVIDKPVVEEVLVR